MPTRKYHHKSTTGCAECKSARVKCDENKPECTRCARQGRSCSYTRLNSAPSPASSSGGAQYNPEDSVPVAVYRQDIELMHHYSVHAYLSLSQEDSIRHVWHQTAVKQALRYPFLLRAIFAFTALHLSSTLPANSSACSKSAGALSPSPSSSSNQTPTPTPAVSSPPIATPTSSVPPPASPSNTANPPTDTKASIRLEWYERAVADYGRSLTLARPELENINEKNCHAALMFSSLIAVVRHAIPQITGDYGPNGVLGYMLESFHLLRGKAAISDAAQNWVLRGPLKDTIADRELKVPRQIPPAILEVIERFETLAAAELDSASEQGFEEARERHGAYMFAIAGVRAYFACQPGDAAGIRIATAWPARLPGPFLACLHNHEPLALAVLAYYAVMLDDQREHWWMADTGKQLLLQIAGVLGGDWAAAMGPAREQMELEIDYWSQMTMLRLFDEGEGTDQPFIGFVNSQELPQGDPNVPIRQEYPPEHDNAAGSGQRSVPNHPSMTVPPTPSYAQGSPFQDVGEEDEEELSLFPAVQHSPFGVSLPTGELPGSAGGPGPPTAGTEWWVIDDMTICYDNQNNELGHAEEPAGRIREAGYILQTGRGPIAIDRLSVVNEE